MFTGMVDHCGTIIELESTANALNLTIECAYEDITVGESIAVDGACLTAINPRPSYFSCNISPETLALTIAGDYKIGDKVNLERSLRLGDRMGGHWVNGHIDQTGTVEAIGQHNDYLALTLGNFQPKHMPLVLQKGSIAVNGVSLTVNQVIPGGCSLMLIPHTLSITNLSHLQVHTKVNLEFDWMAKILLHQLQQLEFSPKSP